MRRPKVSAPPAIFTMKSITPALLGGGSRGRKSARLLSKAFNVCVLFQTKTWVILIKLVVLDMRELLLAITEREAASGFNAVRYSPPDDLLFCLLAWTFLWFSKCLLSSNRVLHISHLNASETFSFSLFVYDRNLTQDKRSCRQSLWFILFCEVNNEEITSVMRLFLLCDF